MAAVRRPLVALLTLSSLATACGGGEPTGTGAPAAPTTVTTAGPEAGRPYPVERVTETFVDTSRSTDDPLHVLDAPERTLVTDVYVPDGDGPFPLVVLAHGNSGARGKFTGLARTWAGAGYVVAVPDFPLTRSGLPGGSRIADYPNQPADVSFVATSVLRLDGERGSPVEGRVDADEIGAAGLSLGGATVYGLTSSSCCRDDRVDAAIVMSGFRPPFDGRAVAGPPLLAFHGDADTSIPFEQGRWAYDDSQPPKFFVTLEGAPHSPPYEDTPSPFDTAVRELTTDFWDAYLYDDRDALDRLTRYRSDADAPLSIDAQP